MTDSRESLNTMLARALLVLFCSSSEALRIVPFGVRRACHTGLYTRTGPRSVLIMDGGKEPIKPISSTDVYDEASRQQLPQLKQLFFFAVVFIGGQLVLGEEGTLNFGRWLSEGPIGPLWNVLAQPLVKSQDLVDDSGVVYDQGIVPTAGFFLIIGQGVLRRIVGPRLRRMREQMAELEKRQQAKEDGEDAGR